MPGRDYMLALTDEKSVREFSSRLLDLVGVFQAELQRLSVSDSSFPVSGYGVLMEVYGLRTRANILLHDAGNHIVDSLGFSQSDLLSLFDRIFRAIPFATNLRAASSLVLSVAIFTVSLGEGKARVVNFLYKELCDEVAQWEK